MRRVYIIGSINTDLVIGAQRLPRMGETVHGTDFFINAGGKGANQAVAAAKLGADVRFCARVGADLFGRDLRAGLERQGVDTRFVREAAGCSSGVALITVVDGNNCIVLSAGANAALGKDAAAECLAEAEKGDILLLQMEISPETVLYALREGKRRGMTVLLNPAPAANVTDELIRACDVLIPNETEAMLLAEESGVAAAAEKLSLRCPHVIVTAGEHGCLLAESGRVTPFSCPKVQTVDTTAAGDTFCGALAVRLARGDALTGAIGFALRAASLAVTRRGAQCSIPTEEEVLAFGG